MSSPIPARSLSPNSLRPAKFAPSSKARALLADLSDSDSDETGAPLPTRTNEPAEDERSQDSEDDIVPASKIASRLQGVRTQPVQQVQLLGTAEARIRTTRPSSSSSSNINVSSDEADDEAAVPSKRRRLMSKQTRASSPKSPSPSQSRSSSHTPERRVPHNSTSPQQDQPALGSSQTQQDKASRFAALVQKKREERLAREAEEEAKRAAREAAILQAEAEDQSATPRGRRVRGSSPADDSEEDDDDDERSKLAKTARPSRKASKKALEEMHRETQRISRNMQLAHQARTKKKFTKDTLLARFNLNKPADAQQLQLVEAEPSSSSPQNQSDVEEERVQSTPPTSPIQAPETKLDTSIGNGALENVAATDDVDDDFSLEHLAMSKSLLPSKETSVMEQSPVQVRRVRLGKSSLKKKSQMKTTPAESDSELDIVTDKASRKKFVAFENLPKKKKSEAPSHLALRSLAHIASEQKRSMNAAELSAGLRRKARLQAKAERDERLEQLGYVNADSARKMEEREQDEDYIENQIARMQKEDEEQKKRERAAAKKNGTYVKDNLDDDDDDDDEDSDEEYEEENEQNDAEESGSDGEEDEAEDMFDDAAEEVGSDSDESLHATLQEDVIDVEAQDEAVASKRGKEAVADAMPKTPAPRSRRTKIIIDDDEDEEITPMNDSPALPSARKTPLSIIRSARKVIPGLQNSDDMPLGLTQAFAATMADSQTQDDFATQGEDSMDIMHDMPSPNIARIAPLQRLDSIDMVSESVAASQTQPLDVNLDFSQSQRVPESPQVGASQAPFELTQDAGYNLSPFIGNRFSETPQKQPHSTVETLILSGRQEESPIAVRRNRLQRGRMSTSSDDETETVTKTAFQVMQQAAKRKLKDIAFDKKRSLAREAFDEAAEEEDDEFAGLGGQSDEDEDESANEDDRQMIDEDTQVGVGDEKLLAQKHAQEERKRDEAAMKKIVKGVGGGWRKRGAGNLDLSDDDDDEMIRRRRERRRREQEKMRWGLLSGNEPLTKFAEDNKKEAFLRSIEDQERLEDAAEAYDEDHDPSGTQSAGESQDVNIAVGDNTIHDGPGSDNADSRRPLRNLTPSDINAVSSIAHRSAMQELHDPPNLKHIISILTEEPSQAEEAASDSDSEDDLQRYADLERHVREAEAEEANEDSQDMGDFIIDDDGKAYDDEFKRPGLPLSARDRAPFSQRRTRTASTGIVVDRLSMMRQASSSTTSMTGSGVSMSRMAFMNSKSAAELSKGPSSLLRRATTNSSLGSMSGRETVSATGVTVSRTERGSVTEEKEFIRKGSSTRRNAVNFKGSARTNLAEEKMSERAGIVKSQAKNKKKGSSGFLGGLFNGSSWN